MREVIKTLTADELKQMFNCTEFQVSWDQFGAIDKLYFLKEKVMTLSDKLKELKSFSPNSYQLKKLEEEIMRRGRVGLIIEKEKDQLERCEFLFRDSIRKIKERISQETGNECAATIARDYALLIIDQEVGGRLK